MTYRLNYLAWLLLVAATPLSAQVFDNPQNLQVLPDDISPGELGETMKSFALGTGYRCSNCHVGEEGQPLANYDFASDEKALKKTARRMLRMVREINAEHLEFRGAERIEVQCVTCHRGVNKPALTADVLAAAVEEGGVEGLRTRYRELRTRYYGTHSFDFSDLTLGAFAQSLAQSGEGDAARTMLDLMLEDDPDSFNAVFLYGELSAAAGDREAAAAYYQRAIEINPRARPFLEGKLKQVQTEDADKNSEPNEPQD